MNQKLDAVESLKSNDCKVRNAAMVYLHEDNKAPFEFLSEVTGLALSTVKNYVRSKFIHLLEWARKIFRKVKNIIRKEASQFLCYIDKVTMPDGQVWCKIGQTTRGAEQRAAEMQWKVNGKKIKPSNVEVMATIECKDLASMDMMENCLRTSMTMINPDKFCKNDRLLCWEDDFPQRIISNPFVQMGLTQFAT